MARCFVNFQDDREKKTRVPGRNSCELEEQWQVLQYFQRLHRSKL